MKKNLKKIAAFVVALSFVMGTIAFGATEAKADDKVYSLALTTPNAESNCTVVAMQDWADKLREESDGRLDITIYAGGTIANANDAFTVTGAGGADLCWITVTQNAGALPLMTYSSISTLGFTNAYQPTYMMVETFKQFPEMQEEFAAQNTRCLAVYGMSPAWLLSNGEDFSTVEDYQGKIVMSSNANFVSMLEGMGCSITGDLPTQIADSMSKSIYKSLLIDFQAAMAFHVDELIDRAYTYNYGTTISFVAINLDVYNSLPEDLQALLDDNFEYLSYKSAELGNENIQECLDARNYELIEVSEDVQAKLDQVAEETIVPQYVEAANAAGADGQAIYDFAKAKLEEAKELYGEEYDWK